MPDPGTPLIAQRWRVVRPLAVRAPFETFLAEDAHTGAAAVLKVAHVVALAPEARLRFEQEAAVLGAVRCPHIPALLDAGADGGRLYVAMTCVEGRTLEARLRAGPLGADEALAVARCLLEALSAAHGRGVLHRDVKPANVVVEDAPSVEWAWLVDFGLADGPWLPAAVRAQPVGTARYVAPEQTGTLQRPVDGRADLYSLGAVLYECLAGAPPFAGESVGEVLRAHLAERPASLRGVPRALDEVVQRLLRKEPRERYQSADAALIDVEAIRAARARGVHEPALVVGRHDVRDGLAAPALVGRAAELAALEAAFGRAAAGHGGVALVEAASGGGKSRLLEELAARVPGAWTLRARFRPEAGRDPFEVAGALATQALAGDGRLAATLADHAAALCGALPALAPRLGREAGAPLGPEAFGAERVAAALTALVDALGTAERPALVLLDDCQWADAATLRMLARCAPAHGLVVAAFRTDEVDAAHALRTLPASVRLTLAPLDEAQARALVESAAGRVPDAVVEVVARLSDGNPFLALAVLAGLHESGAMVPDPAGWRLAPGALDEVYASERAAVYLRRRLDALPEDVLAPLRVGAVLGRTFAAGELAALADLPAARVDEALEGARRRHVVWATDAGWAFSHDRVREALLESLPPGTRTALHLRAAERLEALDPQRVFELSFHFDAAGQPGRALPYARAAGAAARARSAFDVAERHHRIAVRGAADDATRLGAEEALGDVLAARGCYPEAERHLLAARALTDDAAAQVAIDARIAEAAFAQGELGRAAAVIERALDQLGHWRPRSRGGALLRIAGAVLGRPFARAAKRREPAPDARAATDLLASRLLTRLAECHLYARDALRGLAAHLRGLALAERYPATPALVRARGMHVLAMVGAHRFGRACRHGALGLESARATGDPWSEGYIACWHGVALYVSGRLEEAVATLTTSHERMRRSGDAYYAAFALFERAQAHDRLGDRPRAEADAREAWRIAQRHDLAFVAPLALEVWTRCSDGAVPAETIRDALAAGAADDPGRPALLAAEGLWLLGEGRAGEAADRLEAAALGVLRIMRNEYSSSYFAWAATARRRDLEQAEAFGPGRRARRRRALAAARRALREARAHPNNLPHALREAALISALADRGRRARRLFDRGLAEAERRGMPAERARTLLARGRIGRTLEWPDAASDLVTSRREVARLGLGARLDGGATAAETSTLARAHGFAALLEAGRRLATCLDRDAVLETLERAAGELLRAEQCAVILVEDGRPRGGEVPARTALVEAIETGRTVAVVDDEAGAAESLVFGDLRAVLCTPVHVRGRVAACLSVARRGVEEAFGEEAQRIAGFLTTLAGAALENAAGFAEAARLSAALEQRAGEVRRLGEALVRSQEEERREVALTLHDGVGQTLVALSMRLHDMRRGELDPRRARTLDDVVGIVEHLCREMRRISHDLRPSVLDIFGLPEALRDVVESLSSEDRPVALEVDAPDLDDLPDEAAVTLFRVAQAALTNVALHADAHRVVVRLAGDGSEVRLEVEDDGVGFDPEGVAGGGLGLVAMRERVEWLGGRLEVASAPGAGTRVTARLPAGDVVTASGSPRT